MEPKTLKVNEVEYVRKDSVIPVQQTDAFPFEVGKNYFIQTVTHYFTGRLVWVGPQEIMITDACWIADTGRFADFLQQGTANETEPYPKGDNVIIGRGAIITASPWKSQLIKVQK